MSQVNDNRRRLAEFTLAMSIRWPICIGKTSANCRNSMQVYIIFTLFQSLKCQKKRNLLLHSNVFQKAEVTFSIKVILKFTGNKKQTLLRLLFKYYLIVIQSSASSVSIKLSLKIIRSNATVFFDKL